MDAVGKTALVVAEWRRQECRSPAPLAMDHLAGLFVDAAGAEVTRADANFSPGTRRLIHLRTLLFDQRLLESAKRGVDQVVMLGCGLDTRALRLAPTHQTVFEVDRPAVLDFKQQTLEQAGYANPAVAVGCDYIQEDLIGRLEEAGLDPGEETFVLWEGNSMYLSIDELNAVLHGLADGLKQVRLSFDYVSSRLVAEQNGPAGHFAKLGADWQLGLDSIAEIAERSGFEVLENGLIAELVEPVQSHERELFQDYFLCTLESRN
jgi:methyltransferase (TIGR00027 family)